MFTEENLVPTIEQVARRSGLSLRSPYRCFADVDELLRRSRRLTVAETETTLHMALTSMLGGPS